MKIEPNAGWFYKKMLDFDEWLCRRAIWPPRYHFGDRADPNTQIKMTDFLLRLAAGRAQALYMDGKPVPRSLFFSRFAVMLLSDKARTRRLVRTPYGFGSGKDIVIPKADTTAPWGALAPSHDK